MATVEELLLRINEQGGANTQSSIRSLGDVIRALSGHASTTGSSISNFGAIVSNVSAGLKNAGSVLTQYITKPIIDLGLAAISTTMTFDKEMSKVSAVTGATGDDFTKLRDLALDMGRTTSKTSTEAAQAIEYMGLAGWNLGQIQEGLEPILRASEAGVMDLGLTSDLVTDSMAALGIGTKDMGRYLDIAAKSQNTSNQSMQQFLEAMVTAGGSFKMFNVPLEEAGGLLGILANRGYKGSEAGNALISILSNLTTGTGKAGDAMASLGIEVYDSNGKFRGVTTILKELNEKFDGMTDAQRNTYIQMIGGKTRTKELNALLNGTKEELDGLTKGLYNADGSLNKMAKTMQDNLAGQVTRLKSAFEGILIQIGDRLTPYIEKAATFVQKLADKFLNLDDNTQKVILVVLGVVAAIGPLLTGLGILGGLLSGMITLFSVVSTVVMAIGAPIILVTAGITALGIAALAIIKHFFTFREILDGLKIAFDAVKNVIQVVADFLIGTFGPVFETIKNSITGIDFGPILEAFNNIKNTFGPLLDLLKAFAIVIIANVVVAIGVLMSTINGLINAFSSVIAIIMNLVGVITSVFGIIVGIFTLNGELIKSSFLSLWENVKGIFVNAFGAIKGFVVGFVDSIITFFKSLYNTLVGNSIIPDMINGIVQWFTSLPGKILGVVQGFINNVINIFNNLSNNARNIFNSMLNAIVSVWNSIRSSVSSIANGIYSTISSVFSNIYNAISNKINSARNAVSNAMSGIVGVVSSIGSSLYNAGKNIIQSLIDGIKSMASKAKGAVKTIVNGIRDLLPFSPAKEGPLSDLDKTGPAFINTIVEGLKKRQPKLQETVAELSTNLSSVTNLEPASNNSYDGIIPSQIIVEIKDNNIWDNKAIDEIGSKIVKRIQSAGIRTV